MIKSITVTNYLGASMTVDMFDPGRNAKNPGFYIVDIDGLGPCKADINAIERSTMDGASFSSARVNSRNIVLTLGFLSDRNVEKVRRESYRYFPLKKKLHFVVDTDVRTYETYGYVESNEPTIFNKEVSTQISIICPDSYLYSGGISGVETDELAAVTKMFEFPFSNESLTAKLINFGEIVYGDEKNVIYDGDAEVGINIKIHAIGDASNITFHNVTTNEKFSIDTDRLYNSTDSRLTGKHLIAGDDVLISTVKGEKSITLLRDGESINILNCLGKNVNWFQLSKGDNQFQYTATGASNLRITIEHKTAYEGV